MKLNDWVTTASTSTNTNLERRYSVTTSNVRGNGSLKIFPSHSQPLFHDFMRHLSQFQQTDGIQKRFQKLGNFLWQHCFCYWKESPWKMTVARVVNSVWFFVIILIICYWNKEKTTVTYEYAICIDLVLQFYCKVYLLHQN